MSSRREERVTKQSGMKTETKFVVGEVTGWSKSDRQQNYGRTEVVGPKFMHRERRKRRKRIEELYNGRTEMGEDRKMKVKDDTEQNYEICVHETEFCVRGKA